MNRRVMAGVWMLTLAALVLLFPSCQATPTPDGRGWQITPAEGKPRTIPNRRVRQIQYKGHCLASVDGQCWPCEGGEVRPCDEWYQIIDDLTQNNSEVQDAGDPGQVNDGTEGPGQVDDGDEEAVQQEFHQYVAEMLQTDGVAFNAQAVMAAYDLIDLNGDDPFQFRLDMLHVDTVAGTIDFVYIGRDDFKVPNEGGLESGANVQAMLFPLALYSPAPLAGTPIAYRVSGDFESVKAAMQHVFPAGSAGSWTNGDESWSIQVVGSGETYGIEVYYDDVYLGTW